jgi:hypothetical protein
MVGFADDAERHRLGITPFGRGIHGLAVAARLRRAQAAEWKPLTAMLGS